MGVNLEKGQRISLDKEAGGTLTRIRMGLGWDGVESGSGGLLGMLGLGSRPKDIDLDASCILFDGKNVVDVVWFRQLRSRDGSIVHSGDNRTGAGEGDDETITVDLAAVPANISTLVFTVNSFTGQTFNDVKNAYCRLVDDRTNQEVAKYNLSAQGSHTGQIMARIYRHNGEWKMHAIGENGHGRTVDDMVPQIIPML
ncbi:tellurium resistance protein TerZ [Ectothiorhodospira magna]|uniref:Tellurium resistance protein TerZ n=1 Tax=Ectothiorhodospira magna TaxID=867345 RepID=A0A1H9EUU0_9GAMM|nr:TerD family protein [Ectothiorhodospira magna]SEQ29464.1 tellurium resistance protein TerZ [Ectothiorhodospira magna]